MPRKELTGWLSLTANIGETSTSFLRNWPSLAVHEDFPIPASPWHPGQLVCVDPLMRVRAGSIPLVVLVDYYLLGICSAHHALSAPMFSHQILDYTG